MKRGKALLLIAIVFLGNSWAWLPATARFTDSAQSPGNTFQAWAPMQWVQTTQIDFDAGALNQVDTSSSPGDIKLATMGSYVASGTIASQVLGTGIAGARWDALFWDETLQGNTDITFEVRASNSSFVPSTPSGTLPWISIVGNSPITSGLPSGQYMQWRATLTTLDTSETPTLHEVRIYYY